MADPNSPQDNGTQEPPTIKDIVAVSVACVALTGFGILILALLFQLDLTEVRWARATFLLNGVEAVAFAAAGYLFGREVNRGRAENAENLARSESQKGQALANQVRHTVGSARRERLNNLVENNKEASLQSLANMADNLFPPRGPETLR